MAHYVGGGKGGGFFGPAGAALTVGFRMMGCNDQDDCGWASRHAPYRPVQKFDYLGGEPPDRRGGKYSMWPGSPDIGGPVGLVERAKVYHKKRGEFDRQIARAARYRDEAEARRTDQWRSEVEDMTWELEFNARLNPKWPS